MKNHEILPFSRVTSVTCIYHEIQLFPFQIVETIHALLCVYIEVSFLLQSIAIAWCIFEPI